MIAKIIDHSDDPHQRKKIQQVMDVTGKPEDEVATALFDAGWDESRAVELLLEDGDHLSAWEETGKKKKTKKSGIKMTYSGTRKLGFRILAIPWKNGVMTYLDKAFLHILQKNCQI